MIRAASLFLLLLLAIAAPAFAGVTVSTPGNGATVSSPFTLSANAPNCSSQSISAMGYSLDSSTDTTIVNGSSIDAQVPAATGAHTLHVKAWGNQGAVCVTDVAITVTAAAASGGVTVSSPGNGASVPSPFTLTAQAPTCSSQTTSAMGYSLDNSSNTTIVDSKSVSVSITAATGAHTLHVKAWGNQGAACDTDVAINVTAAASTSASVSVASPANNSTVSSPFVLSASAADCSSQPTSAMGYSLDTSADTTIVDSTSVAASISAAAGAHTLHVKAWGNGGASCVTNVAIEVAAAPVSTAADGISVASPGNGAAVDSPFDVVASAPSCSSQPVATMGYSLDNSTNTTVVNGTSVNASVSASDGAHTLHVKAWGNAGASCVANIAINVGAAAAAAANTSAIPSSAISVSSIQTLGNWQASHDSVTGGSASGSMSLVTAPTIAGDSRQFSTAFSNDGGERYDVSFGDDTSATNFFYDAWVYLTSSEGQIANLELDMNQVMANGQTVIYGFQCDGYSGTWDYTKNAGNPTAYSDQWVHSSAPCDVRNWTPNAWHHVQISYSRDDSGNVTYKSVWLDGNQQPINATVPSAFALGWAPTLLTNVQVDGLGSSGSPVIYLDQLTVYRW